MRALGLLTLAVIVTPIGSSADKLPIEGVVTKAQGLLVGGQIVTQSTVLTDSGQELTVTQLGGRAEGLRTIAIHGQPVLESGDVVEMRVRPSKTLRGQAHQVVESWTKVGEDPTYTRTITNKTSVPIYWASGCTRIEFQEQGTTHLDGDQEFTVMEQVLTHWRTSTQSCSYIDLVYDGTSARDYAIDTYNVIMFREDKWCRPATENTPEVCHAANAAAITFVTFVDDKESDRNGEIVDADIEMNATDMAFSVNGQSNGAASCKMDLANILTHEVGHLLGLDHTCWDGQGTQSTDGNGDPLPLCTSTLTQEQLDATMYYRADCLETKKSTVEQDDINGICETYPVTMDPEQCERPSLSSSSGCGCSGSSPGGTLLLFIAGILIYRRRPGKLSNPRPACSLCRRL